MIAMIAGHQDPALHLRHERGHKDGVDVRGYHYWSLMDNFGGQRAGRWTGLFAVDRETQARRLRAAAYRDIIKEHHDH